jgi:aminoglycoside 6'-N-acetyltransferase
MTVTFRRLVPADFPLLRSWLQEPHVARWWNHETEPEAVERDFGPAARGEEPSEDLVVEVDGEPVGLVQRFRLHDYPEYVAELTPHVPVPVEAVSLDYLIGDPARIGKGLGPEVLREAVEDTWRAYPKAQEILIPVVAGNQRSWRSLEKAGAQRIASAHMEPDNPIDPPLHHIYRFARG